uniref:BPTI/Kunitz inhibitor domain-containing protein n=1 Tax=Caenorhabditis tropicalis TaxID=1561998 RepID=A0A1I7UQF9_9PELO
MHPYNRGYLETPRISEPSCNKITSKTTLHRQSFALSRRRDAPYPRSVSARHHHVDSNVERIDCYAVPDPGSCADYKLFWHYAATSNSCRQFYYGGCAGNTNRFDSREKCETSCVAKIEERVESVSEASKSLEEVRLTDPRSDSHFGYHDPEVDQTEDEAEYNKKDLVMIIFSDGGTYSLLNI